MSAWLDLEFSAGTAIEHACIDAQRISDLLGINIRFRFNDVECFASVGGDAQLLALRQQLEQSRKLDGPYDTRFARSIGGERV